MWYKQRHKNDFLKRKNPPVRQPERLRSEILISMAMMMPFAYKTKVGLMGYDVDIWKAIAAALKVKPRFIFLGRDPGATRQMVN